MRAAASASRIRGAADPPWPNPRRDRPRDREPPAAPHRAQIGPCGTVEQKHNGTVGEYNMSNGSAVNASLNTGLSAPYGVALDGNGHLFVANINNGTVGDNKPDHRPQESATGCIRNPWSAAMQRAGLAHINTIPDCATSIEPRHHQPSEQIRWHRLIYSPVRLEASSLWVVWNPASEI